MNEFKLDITEMMNETKVHIEKYARSQVSNLTSKRIHELMYGQMDSRGKRTYGPVGQLVEDMILKYMDAPEFKAYLEKSMQAHLDVEIQKTIQRAVSHGVGKALFTRMEGQAFRETIKTKQGE